MVPDVLRLGAVVGVWRGESTAQPSPIGGGSKREAFRGGVTRNEDSGLHPTPRLRRDPPPRGEGEIPSSLALADQVKSLDWRARKAKKKGAATKAEVAEVLAKARVLLLGA